MYQKTSLYLILDEESLNSFKLCKKITTKTTYFETLKELSKNKTKLATTITSLVRNLSDFKKVFLVYKNTIIELKEGMELAGGVEMKKYHRIDSLLYNGALNDILNIKGGVR